MKTKKYTKDIHIRTINKHMVSLFALIIISFIFSIVFSNSTSALSSSITLNLSASTLSLDLTPKLGGGFAKSGNNTINVKTNHYTGYTLKITAGTNDTNSTKLVNIESNTTIDSIESNVSEADFSANTDAATSYNGKWGFMPSQYVTTDNTNPSSPIHTIVDNDPTGSNASNAVYLPAPDYATGTTLDITNSANPDIFNTYTISLGARAGMETTAGTYSNTFNILAIGNPIIYSITFSDNTGDSSITNLPTGTGSVSTSDIDILLPTTIPTRTGYDFIGWCKTETTTNGTVCPSNTPYPASVPAEGQSPAVPSYYEIDQTTDNTDLTFYATWSPKTYTITLDRNGGDTGSTSTTATYNATTLAAITVPTRSSTTGTRTISGFTMTTAGTNASVTYPSSGCTSASNCKSTNTTTYTFNGWHEGSGTGTLVANIAATPTLQPSTSYTDASSKWTSTSAQTLYAGWNASSGSYSSVTLPTITRTGSTCGWATTSTATSWNYDSGASITPTGDLTLYGVCRNNITLNKNGGTGGSDSTTATYGATALGTITNPTKANTTDTRTISGLAANGTNASGATVTFQSSGNCTSTSNCKSSNSTSYTFNGWHASSGTDTLVANNATTPALQASAAGYTNASKQWTYTTAATVTLYAGWTASAGSYASVTLPTITKTGYTCGWDTNQSATNPTYSSGGSLTPNGNITLYGICKANTYTITLNGNGATNAYTNSTTATYNATTLAAIATLPTKSSTTGTRTISGFTLPSGNNADSASITWPSSGCTSSSNCSSTNTTTYTFNGWHASSGTGALVASSAATPVLQASTSYTDANGKWTSTSAQTLYAGWNTSAGAYSSVTLPQITKTGHTCGWTTTSTGATSITYASGGSITPTGNTTLYGVCTANTYSLTINFAGTGVSSVQVRTASGTGGTLKGTVSTSGGSVSGLTYNNSYYLYPSFSSGYEFDNWAKTSGQGTLSSTSTSNPTYTIGAGNGAVTITGKLSKLYMQNMSSSQCTTTPQLAYDSRDEKSYYIQKLADDNCWMLDNLALDLTDNQVQTNLTAQTTNASDTSLNYLKGTNSRNPDSDPNGAYATSAVSTVWTSQYAPGYSTTYSYSDPRIYTAEENTVPQGSDPLANAALAGNWKAGIYYNYCAATAGSYCYGKARDYGDAYGTVSEDICPKGWRMPLGGSSGEYQTYANIITGTTYSWISGTDSDTIRTNLRLPLSGTIYNGSAPSMGNDAQFWGGNSYLNYYGYSLAAGTTNVNTQNTLNRYYGASVRCLMGSY